MLEIFSSLSHGWMTAIFADFSLVFMNLIDKDLDRKSKLMHKKKHTFHLVVSPILYELVKLFGKKNRKLSE